MRFCNGLTPLLRSRRWGFRECPMPGYTRRLDSERLTHSLHGSDTDGTLSFADERPRMFSLRLFPRAHPQLLRICT